MSADLESALAALRRGGVIAYPTEAVWGLGCDPRNEEAVLKLLALKQRDPGMGLLLIASTFEQLSPYLGPCPPAALERAQASWPGSVNSTHPSRCTRTQAEVQDSLGTELDAIMPGAIGGLERPTPIRDAISGEIVRS